MYYVPAVEYNHFVGTQALNITEASQSKPKREIVQPQKSKVVKWVNSNFGSRYTENIGYDSN